MKNNLTRKIGVTGLFTALTIIHLFPLSLHPSRSASEPIDCIQFTWVLSWVHQHLFINPSSLFNANIFYPHTNTLSFSEHMIPEALISLPIYYISKNPLLAYNFIFLICYVLMAFAMYLLVRYLTQSELAGIVCGIMFSFNTFPIHHITHLQLLNSWPLPLAFLYLHKYFDETKLKHGALFSVFFTLQVLACMYYGLFFISILFVVLPTLFLLNYRKINISFLLKLGLPMVLSGAMLYVFTIPYFSSFKFFGFRRGLEKGADLKNYLAPVPHNVLLGKLLSPLGKAEHFLFPGITALLLGIVFLFLKKNIWKNVPKFFRLLMTVFLLINLMILIATLLTGGFILKLGPLAISAHSLAKQALSLCTTLLLYIIISFFVFVISRKKEASLENRNFYLYLFLFFWALFLSFGSDFTFAGQSTKFLPLPFKWFYEHIPGFAGIRVPARYATFVIFSVIILAGYGLRYLLCQINKKEIMVGFIIALLVFLNLEYLSIPQRIRYFPINKDIPPTYTWLKEREEDFAILELPFRNPIGNDAIYMYFSIFHKKKIVNGYSSFFPPAIFYIRQIFNNFPSWSCLDILRSLGVKYIVLHAKMFKEEKAVKIVQRIQEGFQTDLKLVKKFSYTFKNPNVISDSFGEDLIYEVIHKEKTEKKPPVYTEIPPRKWEISSILQKELLPNLKDGSLETHWTTGQPKKTGDYLLIQFEKPENVAQISLYLGKYDFDYAIDIRVETSVDGINWMIVPHRYSPGEFAKNLINSPKDLVQKININRKNIHFLKITQIGKDLSFHWSVAELKINKKQSKKF